MPMCCQSMNLSILTRDDVSKRMMIFRNSPYKLISYHCNRCTQFLTLIHVIGNSYKLPEQRVGKIVVRNNDNQSNYFIQCYLIRIDMDMMLLSCLSGGENHCLLFEMLFSIIKFVRGSLDNL